LKWDLTGRLQIVTVSKEPYRRVSTHSRSWRFWTERVIYNILYTASLLWIESFSASEVWYHEGIGKIGDPEIDSRYLKTSYELGLAERLLEKMWAIGPFELGVFQFVSACPGATRFEHNSIPAWFWFLGHTLRFFKPGLGYGFRIQSGNFAGSLTSHVFLLADSERIW